MLDASDDRVLRGTLSLKILGLDVMRVLSDLVIVNDCPVVSAMGISLACLVSTSAWGPLYSALQVSMTHPC